MKVLTQRWFDTLHVETTLEVPGFNLRRVSDSVRGISLDEKTTREDVAALLEALTGKPADLDAIDKLDAQAAAADPLAGLLCTDAILSHPVFSAHHTEHEMLRYLKRLENKDLSLAHAMISLGSCTMKLNATSEMIPITWPEFSDIHPFAPAEQTAGYRELFAELEQMLIACTGYDAVSLQPNAGSQGEYAGLLMIRAWHASRGESRRDIF